jgi:hypothetical protein
MESWEVSWTDADGKEHRKEYANYLDAWMFNEQSLKGRGEVRLLTDRLTPSVARAARTEAEAARRLEGPRPRKKG